MNTIEIEHSTKIIHCDIESDFENDNQDTTRAVPVPIVPRLRRFDPNTIQRNSSSLVIAKRQAGKSWLVRNLITWTFSPDEMSNGTVLSASETYKSFYSTFVDPSSVNSYTSGETSVKIVHNAVERQKNMIRHYKHVGREYKNTRSFLVMDDCMTNKQLSETVNEVCMKSRHLQMTLLLAVQHPLDISPTVNSNMDYIFLAKPFGRSSAHSLYNRVGGMFANFETFWTTMDEYASDPYTFLVIDNTQNKKDGPYRIEDHVFWYKAPATPFAM